MPCCFVKRPAQAYGRVGVDGSAAVAARSRAAQRMLAAGTPPAECVGCGTAAAIAAARAGPPSFALAAPLLSRH
jgi:hypothetical protein